MALGVVCELGKSVNYQLLLESECCIICQRHIVDLSAMFNFHLGHFGAGDVSDKIRRTVLITEWYNTNIGSTWKSTLTLSYSLNTAAPRVQDLNSHRVRIHIESPNFCRKREMRENT